MLLTTMETTVGADIMKRLAALPRMSKPQLLVQWKELFGVTPRRQMRRDLLVRFLAYRLQERAFGELRPTTCKRLRDLGSKLNANPNAELTSAPRIKPGTRLLRDWRGQSHQVTVLENGYEYGGKRYSSLSKIARLITGTQWSGPLFFGLRTAQGKEPAGGRRS